MTGFEVHPEVIHAAGQSLRVTGDDFAARLTAFEEQAAAFDDAWGDDTIGTYIGTAYAAVSDWAFSCWETIAEELSLAGDDLCNTATAYQDTETAIVAGFSAIGKVLG